MNTKRKLRLPIFTINPKSYLYGKESIDFAIFADELAEKYDVDILFSAKDVDLKDIARQTKNLIVTAQHMDGIQPGRGMGKVLPEALKEAGVQAVMLNHVECPMSIAELAQAIERADEMGIITFVLADKEADTRAIAALHPDVICCELSSMIGKGIKQAETYAMDNKRIVHAISPETLVVSGTGLRTPEDVYRTVKEGSDGSGGTSGIVCAEDMYGTLEAMIKMLKKAKEDFYK
jgi:triosephosphate isomerase